jgi:hypothetical protein
MPRQLKSDEARPGELAISPTAGEPLGSRPAWVGAHAMGSDASLYQKVGATIRARARPGMWQV